MSRLPSEPPPLGSGVLSKLRLRAYSRRAMRHRSSVFGLSVRHFLERDDFFAADFLPELFPPPPFLGADLRPADFLVALFFLPLPDFLPPPDSLLTVAHARLSAVLEERPRFL